MTSRHASLKPPTEPAESELHQTAQIQKVGSRSNRQIFDDKDIKSADPFDGRENICGCMGSKPGPVEACFQVYRGIFVANKLALEAGIGCRLLVKTSRDCVVDWSRCLADDQVQHWTRWMLSLQEDLWQAM